MILYNKTILLPNLQSLYELLNNNDNESLYTCKCIYTNRIAIKHNIEKKMHTIRIWRTNSLFDYWFDDFNHSNKNFIAALDYTIHKNYIKINYLCVNTIEYNHLYNNSLDEFETEDLIKSLVQFVKLVTKKENKKKIILDVHKNFRIYEKHFYYLGFQITNRKCTDNPFWIQSEIIL